MPILAGDIKLVASQVMDDVPEGGGAPTSTVILDGQSNAIFPDISELDRAGGRVNLRKLHMSVQTTDTATYLGSNIIVAEPPTDPKVSVTLFSTAKTFDRRTDARDRVESYLSPGPEWAGYLMENHIAGQRSIQLFQRVVSDLPPIGRTLLLVIDEGLFTERKQYVRITKVSDVVRTFTYSMDKDYQARVVTCELSDMLRYDFAGSPPSRDYTRLANKTITRDTVVADAAQYFGVTPLAEAVALGSLAAKGASIFTQLVPNAQTEIPIVNANAAGEYNTLVDASNGNVVYTTSLAFAPLAIVYLGNPVFPGSLSVAYPGGTLSDAAGQLMSGTTAVGVVDYARGSIAFGSTSPTYSGSKTVSFKAAGAPLQLADSSGIYVAQESRAYNYIQTINPPPAPGTVRISYRSNGKWYDLRDNGSGILKGSDAAFGTGTISYSTGTVVATVGALPDVGTDIILNWGARVNYFNRAAVAVPPLAVKLQLSNTGVAPDSVSITWNDGVVRTAVDNAAGVLSGDATGTVNFQSGEITLIPNTLPAGNQSYTVDYGYGLPDIEVFPAPLRNGDGTITLALTKPNVKPGSFEMTWNVVIENYTSISTTPIELQMLPKTDPFKTVRDDAAGTLRDINGVSFGTINYITGAVTFHPDVSISIPVPRYSVTQIGMTKPIAPATASVPVYRNLFSRFEYIPAAATMPLDTSALATVKYRAASSDTVNSETLAPGALTFDLTDRYNENIVPGSVNFTMGGKTYYDTLGKLYYDLDISNGSGILAGDINYQSGEAKLRAWVPGQPTARTVHSLLTTMDGRPVDEVTFRAPVAPLRSGSLQLLATRLTGGLINVTASTDGLLTGTDIDGRVDFETGVVRARFGSWVAAAGNEAQIWYSAAAIRADGKIFKPVPVFADTIRFNAVGYSYLPLNADLLGLDPVRLPQDGRVPIFRPGGFAVVGHTASVTATVANAQVIDCARVRLSRVRVIGLNGAVINTGYNANLEAGTVTFTNVTGYSQPVTVEHRIEDMVQVSDVQINGQLAFTRPLTHAYPLGAYISSALVAADLKSRVSIFFDQGTWDGIAWSDSLVGNPAPATFNDVLSPIVVTNQGAVTERWALRFTNSSTFDIVGEHVGVIGTGSINTLTAPINPATNSPYFTIPALGWGVGWVVGNVVRLNTVGAMFPVWVVRTIQQGPESVVNDKFTILVRGDVDRP